jgi:O-antigen/teichoic acid export membrane protein
VLAGRPTPTDVVAINHYVLTYGSRLLVTALGLAISVVSARGLGADGRGRLAVAVTATGVLVQLANLGFSSAIIYVVSRRARRAPRALGLAYTAAGALLAVAALVFGASSLVGVGWPLAGLVVAWAPIQLLTVLQDQVFLGLRRLPVYTAIQMGSRLAALGAAGTAAWLAPGNVLAFASGQVAVEGCAALAGAGLLARSGVAPRAWSWRWLRPVRAIALRALPPLLFGFLLVRSDILLVGWFHPPAVVGSYALAAQLVDLLLLFPGTVGVVLFPRLARSADPARDTARLSRSVGLALAGVAAAMAVLGAPVITLVFGPDFAPAYRSLLLLLPGAVALGYESILTQYFSNRGYPPFLSRYWAAVFALNLVGNLLLVPRLGALGAALTSSACYATLCGLVARRFVQSSGLPWSALWRVDTPSPPLARG